MITFDDTTNETPEYAAFIDKFKPKKTTDDCYTPHNIMDAVTEWAVKEYHLEGKKIVRPFWPGGDYENEDYPDDCVVIDNPPFSILSQICKFYNSRGIGYFLFAPALTLFSTNAGQCNYVIADAHITYLNGAVVSTGFVTNFGDYRIILDPDLCRILKEENAKNTKPENQLPKYDYPDNVVTGATLNKIVKQGIGLRIKKGEAIFTRSLDHQKQIKKVIYGGGFLLSEKAAAEKAAAEKAAAEKAAATKWKLSDRELDIIRGMGQSESVIA